MFNYFKFESGAFRTKLNVVRQMAQLSSFFFPPKMPRGSSSAASMSLRTSVCAPHCMHVYTHENVEGNFATLTRYRSNAIPHLSRETRGIREDM